MTVRPAWMLVLATVALVGATAGAARAGTYTVSACNPAPSGANRSWAEAGDPLGPLTVSACPAESEAGGLYVGPGLAAAAPGASSEWRFVAPAGARVTSVVLDRYLSASAGSGWEAYVAVDGVDRETCAGGCVLGAAPGGVGERATFGGLDASRVAVGLRCAGTSCSAPATAALHGAAVTLSESEAPRLDGVGGALWDTGSYQHGTRNLTLTASDALGIASARLLVDGAGQAPQGFGCDYTRPVPCSDLAPGTLSYDTTRVTDGRHTIEVAVRDPAGNETRSATREIVVDNTPPARVTGLTVAGGEGFRTQNRFDLSWANPPAQAAPIARTHLLICRAGTVDCAAEQVVSSAAEAWAGISVPGPGEWVAHLWLEDAAGNAASANAATAVMRLGPLAPIPDNQPGYAPRPVHRGNLSVTIVKAARSGRRSVVFSGKVNKNATGMLTGTFVYRDRGKRRTVRARGNLKSGVVKLTFKLRHSVATTPRGSMTLRYAGDALYLSRTLTLKVPRPHHR